MTTSYDNTLGYDGGAVKALGGGRIGGVAIRFGSPSDTDGDNEFFHAATDYGRGIKSGADLLYHHGYPRRGDAFAAKFGNRTIGDAGFVATPIGLDVVAQLDTSDADMKALYADVEAGRLGWSTGSVERMVVKTSVGNSGVRRIDRWPIVEVSLTPTPAESRNRAYSLKSLMDDESEPEPSDQPPSLPTDLKGVLGSHAGGSMAGSAIYRLNEILLSVLLPCMGDMTKPKAERVATIKTYLDEYYDKATKLVKALMEEDESTVKSIVGAVSAPTLIDRSEALVSEAEEVVRLYDEAIKARAKVHRTISPAKIATLESLGSVLNQLLAVSRKPDEATADRLRRASLFADCQRLIGA